MGPKETIRRQAEPWQREASEDLAAGRVSQALDRYEAAGRRVYAHPEEALRKILADPKAFDRLVIGEAAAYGELRGQGRFFGKDAARVSAEREIPGLRSGNRTHCEAKASLGRQQSAAARVQGGPTEIKVPARSGHGGPAPGCDLRAAARAGLGDRRPAD